jgi:hypothetical protein
MTTLILNDEEAREARASNVVELQDQTGNVIGRYVRDDLEEDLRIAKETLAKNEETFTTAEVMEYLRSLAPE